jgi:hypothetical protein
LILAATGTGAMVGVGAEVNEESSRPAGWRVTMRWQDQLQGGDEVCRSDREPWLTIRSVVGSQPVTNG